MTSKKEHKQPHFILYSIPRSFYSSAGHHISVERANKYLPEIARLPSKKLILILKRFLESVEFSRKKLQNFRETEKNTVKILYCSNLMWRKKVFEMRESVFNYTLSFNLREYWQRKFQLWTALVQLDYFENFFYSHSRFDF